MAKKTIKKSIKKIFTMFNSKSKGASLLHFTIEHNGKMAGMYSLSTNCKTNQFCQEHRKIAGSICEKCFAHRQMGYMTGMEEPYEKNSELLNELIPFELLPVINAYYFRFEVFGDIFCENQVINYFNICKKNPRVNFALWTKNPFIIYQAIRNGNKKPENINIIYSSYFLNDCNVKILDQFDFIDKIFTVYENEEEARKAGVVINCGSKNCIECGICYENNGTKKVNELLK